MLRILNTPLPYGTQPYGSRSSLLTLTSSRYFPLFTVIFHPACTLSQPKGIGCRVGEGGEGGIGPGGGRVEPER